MGTERTQRSRVIYTGRILNLREDTVELSNGRTATREVVEHRPVVVMVALDDKDNVILVRQYRKAVESELLEAPAGGLNEGESPEQGAQREMKEETGFRAGKIQSMGGFFSAPGFCTEYLHAFLCTDLRHVGAHPEDDEEIAVEPTPVARIPELIRTGRIRDAKSVAGLLMYLSLYRPR